MTLWYVVGGIFLAAVVIVGFVAVNRRAALRRAEEQKQLRAGEAAGGRSGDDGGAVDVLDRPAGSAPPATDVDVDVDVPMSSPPEARPTGGQRRAGSPDSVVGWPDRTTRSVAAC